MLEQSAHLRRCKAD